MKSKKFWILWNTEDKPCVEVCISALGLYIYLYVIDTFFFTVLSQQIYTII